MKSFLSLSFSALLGLVCASAYAQSTASLSGVVTDPTGAVVPGVHVTIHSLGTGADRDVVSDSAGLYTAPSLLPGDYRIVAKAPGFSTDTVDKLTLNVDQHASLNLHLAVASTGETVQVESAVVTQIETETMTVGQVIDRNTVQELPLNGRHFLDLTTLTPGGVVAPTAGSLTASSRGLGSNAFITAGNREDSVNFQINGINLNDMSQNQITFQPSINTTSEFKIDNSTFSAEYGRSSGSIVNVSTRSGTNAFHGEVFDYFRNEALDARNYFNRSTNVVTGQPLVGLPGKKAPLKRNNFGVALGGPIWRDHTFFFFSYEGLRQHQGILQNAPVFTPAQRSYITSQGNPTALAILALIPTANNGSNYTTFTPGPVQIDQYTGDVLQNMGTADTLHAFYAFQKDVRTEPSLQGDTIPGFGDHRAAHRQVLTFNEIHTFSPKLVNEARLGFNRISISFLPNFTTNPASLGLGTGVTAGAGIPYITFSDLSGLALGGPSGFPQGRTDTLGVISDTLTMLHGKHTIKAGGEFRRFLEASFAGDTGSMSFATSINTTPTATSPNDFASGRASTFTINPTTINSRVYINAGGLFVQDNYKPTAKLVLEGGLRFEWNGTPVEGNNRFVLFQPNFQGGPALVQVGTNGYDKPYQQNYNLEPRVGFTYDVSGKGNTVIRGGYGFMVDQPVETVVGGLTSNPPFSNRVSFVGNSTNTVPVSNMYGSALASGLSVASVNPHFRNAYTEDYNLNVQQAVPWGMVASIGYYGSTGHHLRIATNENQPVGPDSAHQVRPYLALASTSPIDAGKSINSNITEANSIGWSNYNAMWITLGKNMSHGLQFNVNYEWAKSMDSNSLGSQGGLNLQDSNNPAGNYGLSDFDVRHHFAGTAIYELPFRGNRFVSGYRLQTIVQYQTGNPVNIVASSDNFNGVAGVVRPNLVGHPNTSLVQTGTTSNVTYIHNPAGTVCNEATITSACVFEVVQAANGVYNGVGNIQRNSLSGPGFADVDLSGEKSTKLFENVNFILRADAFDIFNHPNFGQPISNVQSSSFGLITATRFATSDGGSSRQLQLSAKFQF